MDRLPDCLLLDVIARLGYADVRQCKCVCKHWKHLIESPIFSALWKPKPTLLLKARKLDKQAAAEWRLKLKRNNPESAKASYKSIMKSRTTASHQALCCESRFNVPPMPKKMTVHASTQGLLFFSLKMKSQPKTFQFYVGNPVTGACTKLPDLPPRIQGSENIQMFVKGDSYTIFMLHTRLVKRKFLARYSSTTGTWKCTDEHKVGAGSLQASDTSSFLVAYIDIQPDNSRRVVTAAFNGRDWHELVTPQTELPPPTYGGFDEPWSFKYKFFTFQGVAMGYRNEFVFCDLNGDKGTWEETSRHDFKAPAVAEAAFVPEFAVERNLVVAYSKYKHYHGLAPLVVYDMETGQLQELQTDEKLRTDIEAIGVFTPNLCYGFQQLKESGLLH